MIIIAVIGQSSGQIDMWNDFSIPEQRPYLSKLNLRDKDLENQS